MLDHPVGPGGMPDGTILEHVCLHADRTIFYEKRDGKWIPIERWDSAKQEWVPELPGRYLNEPVDDPPDSKIGFYCVFHGLKYEE